MYQITYLITWSDSDYGKFGFSIERQCYVGDLTNFHNVFMKHYDGNGIKDVTVLVCEKVRDLSDIDDNTNKTVLYE